MLRQFSIAVVCGVLAFAPAHADSLNAKFSATVANTCTLTAGLEGLLVPNASSRQLDSRLAGGGASRVTAQASATGFKLSAIAPSSFTSAPAGQAATFRSWYSISGATTRTNINGNNQTTLNQGSNLVAVDLRAAKSGGGPFADGNYAAEVVVRCE